MDKHTTHLDEMAEFFPVAPKRQQPVVIKAVALQPGETQEEAERKQQERTARIRQQIADRATGSK